ncbi:glutathione S-transferase family protein [Sphingobium sp. JS3065]|uniref:glutathione S-transferase family protein n=1 Tax=Sphingobium sp. JS3065 TaxID=2970925 RepID=UPI0022647CFE|nr:glutathione S-transferase family protein [Sphingobium sp. JS3065]UZW53911.1 glutathione S-transferase family protein [Sphingobium sp. JS3065]
MAVERTLYHSADSRSFRALWALEEVGIPYTLELLDFPPRQTNPTYLEKNPLGTVPLFVEGELRMTESAAICHYLGARYGSDGVVPEVDDPSFGAFLNYLHFGEATLTFPQAIVLRYGRLEPQERRSAQVVSDYSRWFLARARGIEMFLERGDYATGDAFTMADISVGYAIMLSQFTGLFDQLTDPVQRYWDRLRKRPAFMRATVAQRPHGRL